MFEFTIDRDSLKAAMKLIKPERDRNCMWMSCAHFVVNGGGLSIGGASFDYIKLLQMDVVTTGEGQAAVDFQRLYRMVNLLPKKEELTIIASDNLRLTIKHSGGDLHFPTFDPLMNATSNALQIPEGKLIAVIPKATFAELINSVKYAVCPDPTKYFLHNIKLFSPPGTDSLCSAATDGHRLVVHTVEAEKRSLIPGDGYLVPVDIIGAVPGFTEDVQLFCSETQLSQTLIFKSGRFTFSARSEKDIGNFPDLNRVIPLDNYITRTTVEPKSLIPVATRVLKLLQERGMRFQGIYLTFKDNALTAEASFDGYGLTEMIPCLEPFDVGAKIQVNSRYLIDALKQASGPVNVMIYDDTRPIKLTTDKDVCVIMPMRL